MQHKEQGELEERYIRGYIENPETPEEVEGAYLASLAALAENPWDDEEITENQG